MKSLALITIGILAIYASSPAVAAEYKLDFSASNFTPYFGAFIPPTDPVSGNISYTADGPFSQVTSIQSIDLVIDSHAFTLSEIGAESTSSSGGVGNTGTAFFGGTIWGVTGMGFGDRDFSVYASLNPSPFGLLKSGSLSYTTNISGAGWYANTFNYSISAVPEPSVSLILSLGLIPVLALRYRQRRGA